MSKSEMLSISVNLPFLLLQTPQEWVRHTTALRAVAGGCSRRSYLMNFMYTYGSMFRSLLLWCWRTGGGGGGRLGGKKLVWMVSHFSPLPFLLLLSPLLWLLHLKNKLHNLFLVNCTTSSHLPFIIYTLKQNISCLIVMRLVVAHPCISSKWGKAWNHNHTENQMLLNKFTVSLHSKPTTKTILLHPANPFYAWFVPVPQLHHRFEILLYHPCDSIFLLGIGPPTGGNHKGHVHFPPSQSYCSHYGHVPVGV